MITESCTVTDDDVYLHEVDLVISAFFLFMDLLLPEVATAYEVLLIADNHSYRQLLLFKLVYCITRYYPTVIRIWLRLQR